MSELQTRIARANPRPESDRGVDDLIPPFAAIWLAARRAPTPVRRRPAVRFARIVVSTPRGWVALAAAGAAVVVAALVLSAGTAPSSAQALPIFSTPATDLSGRFKIGNWLPGEITSGALRQAHSFAIPDGIGYVVQAAGGSDLCLLATPNVGPSAGVGWVAICGSTGDAEDGALIFTFGFVASDYDYVAFVPSGGSAQLTQNGITTQVPISNGIAAGDVHDAETLTIQTDGVTHTRQLGPQSSEPPNSNDSTPPPAGATGSSNAP
jgi:hypothetical protein